MILYSILYAVIIITIIIIISVQLDRIVARRPVVITRGGAVKQRLLNSD